MLIDPKFMRFASQLSSVVMTKALLIYGAYRLGTYLDGKFGTYPLFFFLLITTAAGLGLWWIIKIIEKNRI